MKGKNYMNKIRISTKKNYKKEPKRNYGAKKYNNQNKIFTTEVQKL